MTKTAVGLVLLLCIQSALAGQEPVPATDAYRAAGRLMDSLDHANATIAELRSRVASQRRVLQGHARRLDRLAQGVSTLSDSIDLLLGRLWWAQAQDRRPRFVPMGRIAGPDGAEEPGAGGLTADGIFLGIYRVDPLSLNLNLPRDAIRTVAVKFEPFPWHISPDNRRDWFMRLRLLSPDTSMARITRKASRPDPLRIFPLSGATETRWDVRSSDARFDTVGLDIEALVGQRKSESSDSIEWDARGWQPVATVRASRPPSRRLIDVVNQYLTFLVGLSGIVVGALGGGWLRKLRAPRSEKRGSPRG